jgi:hypothetical protein
VRTLWTKETKPHLFERTATRFATMTPEQLEDRGFLTPDVKTVVAALPDGAWLAGSWFESIYRGEAPKDLDVFFRDPEALYEFLDAFKPDTESIEFPSEDERSLTDYELPDSDLLESLLNDEKTTAITVRCDGRPSIQIIRARFFDSPEAVIDSFDFTACQFAIGKEGLVFSPGGMLDMVRKRLVVHRITFPASTMRRMIKYTAKGYYACGGSFVEMVKMMREAPAEDAEVLYVD